MTHLREEHLVCAQLLIDPCNRSVRSTAVELGVSESTLRYRLKRRQAALSDGRTAQAEACSAHAAVIEAWMADQQEMLQSGGRPAPIRALYDVLVRDHGYTGSYKAVARYVGRRRPRPRIRPVRRVEVDPGGQAQVDWVEPVVDVQEMGDRMRLTTCNLTLSFSRICSVQWRLDQGQLSWQEAHNRSFMAVEGVLLSVRFDNCKTAVARHCGP